MVNIKAVATKIVRDWIQPQHMSVTSQLREWGAWGAMQNIGYATMSPMFGEVALKTPLHSHTSASPEVLKVDAAVRAIESSQRALLIEKYQLRMHWQEICNKWGWSRSTYFRNIEEAHDAVRKALG